MPSIAAGRWYFSPGDRQLADPAGAHSPPQEAMLLHGW
jgi:hypothetical protein